jgi:undecaprenyl-diphosphatase
MALFDLFILAVIQGITEFLPISSSGHLALWPLLSGQPDQGLAIDVAVHLGTLVAVCLFFRADIGRIFRGTGQILTGRPSSPETRLVWLLALATIPAIVAGVALKLSGGMDALRAVEVIGWATLLGAFALYAADRWGGTQRTGATWGVRDAVIMGLAQAVALIPGVSRSGACMTLARALGFDRAEGARIALLMAVPTILAAGAVTTLDLLEDDATTLGADFALGAAMSCVAALLALTVMMRMFRADWTMTPFVLYRIVLGIFLLWIAYG